MISSVRIRALCLCDNHTVDCAARVRDAASPGGLRRRTIGGVAGCTVAAMSTRTDLDHVRELMALATGDEKHAESSTSTLDALWVLYDRVLHVDPAAPRDEAIACDTSRPPSSTIERAVRAAAAG